MASLGDHSSGEGMQKIAPRVLVEIPYPPGETYGNLSEDSK